MMKPTKRNRIQKYLQIQESFQNIKERYGRCPKCGDSEIYYENPRTGNGLYNCCSCGYAGHDRGFKQFKVRKVFLRRWKK